MTLTSTQADRATTRTEEQRAHSSGRGKRGDVIKAIRDEAVAAGVDCSRRRAEKVYKMLERAVVRIRKHHYAPYHIKEEELRELHPVLSAIMPDEVVNPPEGSAHTLLHRRLLQDDEFALVHTRDHARGVEYCAVAIQLSRML